MDQLGHIEVTKEFIDKSLTEYYFHELETCIPWQTIMWKKGKILPRMCHRYDPLANGPIEPLDQLIQMLNIKLKTNIEGCWCNLYRNGADNTPWHQDSYNADIFTLSFGSTRDCLVRTYEDNGTRWGKTGKSECITLNKGDLLFFDSKYDSHHQHSIPVRKRIDEPRISIVFFAH